MQHWSYLNWMPFNANSGNIKIYQKIPNSFSYLSISCKEFKNLQEIICKREFSVDRAKQAIKVLPDWLDWQRYLAGNSKNFMIPISFLFFKSLHQIGMRTAKNTWVIFQHIFKKYSGMT